MARGLRPLQATPLARTMFHQNSLTTLPAAPTCLAQQGNLHSTFAGHAAGDTPPLVDGKPAAAVVAATDAAELVVVAAAVGLGDNAAAGAAAVGVAAVGVAAATLLAVGNAAAAAAAELAAPSVAGLLLAGHRAAAAAGNAAGKPVAAPRLVYDGPTLQLCWPTLQELTQHTCNK